MRAPVSKAGAALTGMLILGSACTYYNSIYNAEHAFNEAERLRREGQDSVAAARYDDVIRKAARGFRSDPTGRWAYASAFLLGRAHLRAGDLDAARAALDQSTRLATTPDERLAAQVFSGLLEARLGHRDRAIALFNEALAGASAPAVRAEGHLHRGGLLLAGGYPDGGWWDLDRAAALHPPIRVEASLERLHWSIVLGDRRRTEESVQRLLSYPEAAVRADALVEILGEAEDRWGAAVVADLLSRARNAAWERDLRDRMVLEQARALRRAELPDDAERTARSVADGRGPWAAEARLTLARWVLAGADDVGDAYALRVLLLPAVDQPAVADLLAAIDRLEALTFSGLDTPLAWFLAGEVARDRLGARRVARDLFLAYATSAPEDPWAPKAILAALPLTDEEETSAELRARLERHPRSPYVLAARGRPAVGFEALEEELLARLSDIARR